MLTKTIVIGSIEILETLQMQIREDTVVDEDGLEISRTYLRYVIEPGDDVSTKPDPIPALANLLWTPEAITAWKTKLTDIRSKLGIV